MTERAGGPRIGLFGGTFNPIHLGHLRAAEEVREVLALDRILFIPSAIPPHKRTDPKDPIAEAKRRLQWTQRAIEVEKEFSVDPIEIDRPGPSFLVDTLEAIRQREPKQTRIVFIVGEDAFAEMGDWREPERLFALADLAVMTRPPGQLRDLAQRIPEIVRKSFGFSQQGRVAQHREAGTRIDLISITALDISSTEIRSAIRRGRSIRYLVPESIREEIERSGCYGPLVDEENG
ncbi:MAG: nicotinate (nicotinamide) nucleotide adenylyltransferase [Deltaproteobacteria bacterium]|nr:nicotinate (nicotinamide) nucleotide adenylyltransferase [Deltaproteobacteria bacterium]